MLKACEHLAVLRSRDYLLGAVQLQGEVPGVGAGGGQKYNFICWVVESDHLMC